MLKFSIFRLIIYYLLKEISRAAPSSFSQFCESVNTLNLTERFRITSQVLRKNLIYILGREEVMGESSENGRKPEVLHFNN